MNGFSDAFSAFQLQLFEVVAPWLFQLGMGNLLEEAYAASTWLLVGLIQIAVLLLVIGPLQRWWPAEAVTDRASIRTDVIYTLIHRLGLFRVALFFSLEPLFNSGFGFLRTAGVGTFHLDQVWPGVTDGAVVSFIIYLLALDLAAYWLHRGQHRIDVWWRLHSLHHSQQQMTMWSDNRNHLLDDVLVSVLLVLLAQLMGVAPEQFVVIVALTQLSESLQHANVRMSFGRIGERLWVSPLFHRVHHSVYSGNCNYGVLLPWWDQLFGTANFQPHYDPTGVTDSKNKALDDGPGLWSQQWCGLKRLLGRV